MAPRIISTIISNSLKLLLTLTLKKRHFVGEVTLIPSFRNFATFHFLGPRTRKKLQNHARILSSAFFLVGEVEKVTAE